VHMAALVSVTSFGKKRVGALGVFELETRQAVAWGVLEENFLMVWTAPRWFGSWWIVLLWKSNRFIP
jgi:hypothetical protein